MKKKKLTFKNYEDFKTWLIKNYDIRFIIEKYSNIDVKAKPVLRSLMMPELYLHYCVTQTIRKDLYNEIKDIPIYYEDETKRNPFKFGCNDRPRYEPDCVEVWS